MNNQSLLTAPIVPTIARMAAPNVIAMFIMLATSVMEAWYVGQLGTRSLAGLALTFPMFMLMGMLSAGAIGGAVAGAVAQALGAGDRERAEAITLHAVLIGLGFAVFFSLIFTLFGTEIYSALGGEGETLAQALAYSNIFFAGSNLFWMVNMLSSIVRACGHMRLAGMAMAVSSFVQIGAGAAFILGLGPFPQLGMMGAGIAVVLAAAVGTAILLFYLLSGRLGVKLHLRGVPLSRHQFGDLLRPGLLASVGPVSSIATVAVVTDFVARQGDAALAGYGIGTRMEFLLIPVIFGIGAALITLVGVHFGAGEIDRGHEVAWVGAFGAALITGVIGAVLAGFPGLWAHLFTDVEAVREACRTYLRIVGPFYGFFGLGLALFFASQGARRLFWPVAAGVLRLMIIVVLGGAMMLFWEVTMERLFWLIAFGLAVYGTAMAAVVKFGGWR